MCMGLLFKRRKRRLRSILWTGLEKLCNSLSLAKTTLCISITSEMSHLRVICTLSVSDYLRKLHLLKSKNKRGVKIQVIVYMKSSKIKVE